MIKTFAIGFNMKNKILTKFSINDENKLIRDGKTTDVTIIDDYFYKNGKELDVYIEDGRMYKQNQIFPFIGWLKISSPLSLFVDEEKNIYSNNSDGDDLLTRLFT